MTSFRSGLDRLVDERFERLRGRSFGILCNQASVDAEFRPILRLMEQAGVRPKAIFSPQHGLYGHTQDNMIEWEGRVGGGVPIYSLYSHVRKPTPEMLDGLDLLVIDLPDVGARYYTFAWTVALCLEAARELNLPVLLLDRPNPIGGLHVEGPVLQAGFESFVGLYPLPARHGLTLGELATMLGVHELNGVDLTILSMKGWDRAIGIPEGYAWVPPSPNMPTPSTALVYPGMCLFEATNLSEGRGTTRPFELFGAPWIDSDLLADRLNAIGLPGIYFRPHPFQPTFNKFAGILCGGVFLHVIDAAEFKPVVTGIAILREIRTLYPDRLAWKQPPYEYEFEKLPIDILAGNDWVRESIDALAPLDAIYTRMEEEAARFEAKRRSSIIYASGEDDQASTAS